MSLYDKYNFLTIFNNNNFVILKKVYIFAL